MKNIKNIKKLQKGNNGISLVALVITIIILLILASITMSQLTQNGLIEKVKQAKEESIKSQIQEEIQLELIDINTEYMQKNIKITNEIIQEELEKRLSGIKVKEDLTGSYKEYEYEIDESFNVHIIDKVNNSINIKINQKIGTSYIKINVEADSKYGDIKQYQYIIDGKVCESTEAEYTVEELEPESEHTIKVIVIDEKQNKKQSKEIKVKTEPRTYLYNMGNEYTELTGGWIVGYINGDNPGVGSALKKENYIEVKSWGYWHGSGCYTKNQIDLKEYSKIKVDIFDCSAVNITGGYEQIAIGSGNKQIMVLGVDNIQDKIYELDITDINPNSNIICVQIGNGANGNIRRIWLEK